MTASLRSLAITRVVIGVLPGGRSSITEALTPAYKVIDKVRGIGVAEKMS